MLSRPKREFKKSNDLWFVEFFDIMVSFLDFLHMTVKTFFSDVGKDAYFHYEQMLKRQVIDKTVGHFNPLRPIYYQPDIATPLTSYRSFKEFCDHGKNLFASILMMIPNMVIGVLSAAYYALLGTAVVLAKLIWLPFSCLFKGLFPGDEEGCVKGMANQFSSNIKAIIGSFVKWSLGTVNAILETIHDVVLLPLLLTMSLGSKNIATAAKSIVNGINSVSDYCIGGEENSNPAIR